MILTSRRIGDNVTDSEPLDPAQETVEKVIFELPEGVKSVCGNQTWHLPVDLMGENSAL